MYEYTFVGYVYQRVMVTVTAPDAETASDRAYDIHPDDWEKVGVGCVEEVEILECDPCEEEI